MQLRVDLCRSCWLPILLCILSGKFAGIGLDGTSALVVLLRCCLIVEDLIEIQDVALLNASDEWTDDVYSLSASVMDGVSICWRLSSLLLHAH